MLFRLPIPTGTLDVAIPPRDESALLLDLEIDRLLQLRPVLDTLGLLDSKIERADLQPMPVGSEFGDWTPVDRAKLTHHCAPQPPSVFVRATVRAPRAGSAAARFSASLSARAASWSFPLRGLRRSQRRAVGGLMPKARTINRCGWM